MEIIELNRQIVLKQLSQVKAYLLDQFGITSLTLFGSLARDEARPNSDIDLLVEFSEPLTYDHYIHAKFYLEDLLGRQVDLVIPDTLKNRIRSQVEKEALHVS